MPTGRIWWKNQLITLTTTMSHHDGAYNFPVDLFPSGTLSICYGAVANTKTKYWSWEKEVKQSLPAARVCNCRTRPRSTLGPRSRSTWVQRIFFIAFTADCISDDEWMLSVDHTRWCMDCPSEQSLRRLWLAWASRWWSYFHTCWWWHDWYFRGIPCPRKSGHDEEVLHWRPHPRVCGT